MKNLLPLALMILAWLNTYSQVGITDKERNMRGVVTFARVKNDSTRHHMKDGIQLLKELLRIETPHELRLEKTEADDLGLTHQYYSHHFNNIRVEYSAYAVHGRNGLVENVNGNFIRIAQAPTSPSLSERTALTNAIKFIGAKKYKWEVSEEEAWISRYYKKSYYPTGSLVIVPDKLKEGNSFVLAWKFDIYAHQPLSRNYVYVNANDGSIIGQENLIEFVNTSGTASTHYNGQRSIISDSFNGGFRLRETRDGVMIQTYNMLNQGANYGSAPDFNDGDNNWSSAEFHNANMDDAALDAHWGTEMIYDYWNTVHARNSWNGIGGPLLSYVHANLPAINQVFTNNDNAFWDGQRMTYGDGTTLFGPLTSIDICAHEIGHGVCTSTVNWTGSGETGAINEGFSDIWGACVEQWATSNKQTWLIGEDVVKTGNALRNMSNPNEHNQPDTRGGTFWMDPNGQNDNGGVHTNNGVVNFWFYLLSQGGSGTNDLNKDFAVSGIGINSAARIAYRAERFELTQSPPPAALTNITFDQLRTATINAATNIFCASSKEVAAVTNAWNAVGVGAAYAGTVPSLVGTEPICSSQTFTVQNPIQSSSTVWASDNLSALTVNSTNGNATRANSFNGIVNLNATQAGAGGCSTIVSKPVVVGTGIADPLFEQRTVICPTGPTFYTILGRVTQSPDPNASYKWYIGTANRTNFVLKTTSTSNSATVPGDAVDNLYHTLRVDITNTCGTVVTAYPEGRFKASCSGGGGGGTFAKVFPNPVSNQLTIGLSPTQPDESNIKVEPDNKTDIDLTAEFEAKLFDSFQQLVRSGASQNGVVNFNVADLPNGIYYLKFENENLKTVRVMIHH